MACNCTTETCYCPSPLLIKKPRSSHLATLRTLRKLEAMGRRSEARDWRISLAKVRDRKPIKAET